MASRIRIGVIVLFLVCAGGLGCKKKKPDEKPTEPIGKMELRRPEASGTEKAEGDVRDAMLALQRVHFGFDSADLTDPSRNALEEAATKLKGKEEVHLYVEGHADQAGETEYNMTLGERRAKAVSDYLSTLGIDKDRLHIVSYGEEKPLASGADAKAMAKNRRVDFRVMRGEIELVLEESDTVQ